MMKDRDQRIAWAIEGLERIDPKTVKSEEYWHLHAWQAATSAIRTIEDLEEENAALRSAMGVAIDVLHVPHWRTVSMGEARKRLTVTLPVEAQRVLMEMLAEAKGLLK